MLSRDPEVGRLVSLDTGSPSRMTVRLGAFGSAAQERVRAMLATLAVPTLVFHGSDDRLVPPTATEPFEGPLPGVTRRVYPGLRHETLMSRRARGRRRCHRGCATRWSDYQGSRSPARWSSRRPDLVAVSRPSRASRDETLTVRTFPRWPLYKAPTYHCTMTDVAPDGSPVAFYRRLPATGEPELIHGVIAPGASPLDLGCGTGRIADRSSHSATR